MRFLLELSCSLLPPGGYLVFNTASKAPCGAESATSCNGFFQMTPSPAYTKRLPLILVFPLSTFSLHHQINLGHLDTRILDFTALFSGCQSPDQLFCPFVSPDTSDVTADWPAASFSPTWRALNTWGGNTQGYILAPLQCHDI